jgi:putative ABC transport system permease protein
MRVPLAWHNLTYDRRRLGACVAGVAFAVFLMFVEMGFWNALLDASAELIRRLNGELVIASKARYALIAREPFTRRRLAQARAVPGVRAAFAVYVEYAASFWKDVTAARQEAPNSHPIRVIAFDPTEPVLRLPAVLEHGRELEEMGTVLLDVKSKREYGARTAGIERELGGRKVRVAATFALGTDFTTNGNVIMGDQTFARLFPNALDPAETLGMADLGVVQVEPGADPRAVRDRLRRDLPDDVAVYTREEFARHEMAYWQTATPIGFVFGLGLCMGLLVGGVICYQVIASDVSDHLAEFATLKAMGYGDGYLRRVVLHEALWLSLLGFGPGLVLAGLLYWGLGAWVGLPMRLTAARALLVFLLAAATCVLSGVLALRRVRAADPAEVFG